MGNWKSSIAGHQTRYQWWPGIAAWATTTCSIWGSPTSISVAAAKAAASTGPCYCRQLTHRHYTYDYDSLVSPEAPEVPSVFSTVNTVIITRFIHVLYVIILKLLLLILCYCPDDGGGRGLIFCLGMYLVYAPRTYC